MRQVHAPDISCLLQHGLIAGGLADGSIAIWDAQQILKGRPESALLAKEPKHRGAVSCLACHAWPCLPQSSAVLCVEAVKVAACLQQ